MRAYWILPNREQRDDILASDGKTILPLRQVLEPKLRPEGFSHGVPAELLERCGGKELQRILFAQKFPAGEKGQHIFSIFSAAGCDATGRVVHLGLMFLLEPGEQPRFELAYAGLPKQDQPYASALLHRLTSRGRGDLWAQSVLELSELPASRAPATNVALERSAVRFFSLYDAGRGGLTRRYPLWSRALVPVVSLVLCAVLGMWLSVRACGHPLPAARPAAQMGVRIWHFN